MKFTLSTIAILTLGFSVPAFAEECQTENPETLPNQPVLQQIVEAAKPHGVGFQCAPDQIKTIERKMDAYLAANKIDPSWLVKKVDPSKGELLYTLNTPEDDFDTLTLKDRKEYGIQDDVVSAPKKGGGTKKVKTVSRKEIVLALFQHGRFTQFSGDKCDAQAFIDHVGIRQNTVMWAENLEWGWPDGDPAYWNKKLWDKGTPRPGVPMTKAFKDAFLNQKKYGIGCYTATKLVMVQGVLDYYKRVSKNPKALKKVEAMLNSDKDPLVSVEPRKMWSFENDFDMSEIDKDGKILTIQYGIAPRNFVPGDWNYILNTDPVTYERTGYEGSNAVYLGRGHFDDYYNDNNHKYSYKEKINEVYQWRHGVFNSVRDKHKVKPLTEEDIVKLGYTPKEGGLMQDFRTFPKFF